MDWNLPYLTEEHKNLIMLTKEFCEREVDIKALNELADRPMPPNATHEDLMARMPWDLISKAHDAGLRQLPVPTEYGGGDYGRDFVALGVCAETAGYYGGQMARILSISWKNVCSLIYAPKTVQDEVFTDFMQNRKAFLASSASEANHGSDYILPYDEPGATGTYFARREGDEWILNGDKMWCEGAGIASYILLTVRTEPKGPISKSATRFAFPAKTPGWSIRVNDMMGNEVVPNVQQHYENCRIPDRLRISPVNEGLAVHRSNLAFLTMHLLAHVGWAFRTWEEMKEYAKARIQGGKPIIQHNNVGMVIAEGDCLLQSVRLFLYQYCWECSQEGESASALGWYYGNWYIKKVLLRLIEIGFEVYGGMGPQKELAFEHWVRVHLSMFHGGSTGIMNLIKAAGLLEKE